MSPELHLTLLAAVWLGYFVLHSLCASLGAKQWVATHHAALMPAYRLGFNGLAVLLLVPPAALMLTWPGPPLWAWTGGWAWLSHGLGAVAVGLFLWSLASYDSGEFIGLRQWRQGVREVADQEQLHISPLHRHVRHPWYFCLLLLVWTRDMDAARLLSSVLATGYLVIGSRLEEHKLLHYHGTAYARYRAAVPGLVPWPGRALSVAEADEIVALARESESAEGAATAVGRNDGV